MATDFHSIHLTGEQWKLLAELASRTGKRPEEVVAEALRGYEFSQGAGKENGQSEESLYEALSRRGLIGCIADGPPDLSTNPKYMEGFGESNS
jgi:hypothetical protein